MPIDVAGDARRLLEDPNGFRRELTLTSPAGVVTALGGYATDVSESVDPETGTVVAGRRASVAVSLLSIALMPEAEAEAGARPWVVTFADLALASTIWKVVEVRPDRAVGVVVLLLETYDASVD
jgi:hypothetical protein